MNFSTQFFEHLQGVLKVEKVSKIEPLEAAKIANNLIYTIDTSSGPFLLRLYPNDRVNALQEISKYEYETLKKIEDSEFSQFAPKVYYYDSSKKYVGEEYVVMELIQGSRPGGLGDLKSKESIDLIGKLLRKFHSSFPMRSIDDILHEREYELYINEEFVKKCFLEKSKLVESKLEAVGLKDFPNLAAQYYEKSKSKAEPKMKEFEKGSRKFRIHGDFHVANLMFNEKDGTDIKVVDWETSRYGNYYEDLAKFIVSGLLQGELEAQLLKSYGIENFDETLLWMFKVRVMGHMVAYFIRNSAKPQPPPIFVMGLKIYFQNFMKLIDSK